MQSMLYLWNYLYLVQVLHMFVMYIYHSEMFEELCKKKLKHAIAM